MKKRMTAALCIGVIGAILVVLVLNGFTQQTACICSVDVNTDCTDYHDYLLVTNKDDCHCGCIPLSLVFNQWIFFGLLPFIGFASVGWYAYRPNNGGKKKSKKSNSKDS